MARQGTKTPQLKNMTDLRRGYVPDVRVRVASDVAVIARKAAYYGIVIRRHFGAYRATSINHGNVGYGPTHKDAYTALMAGVHHSMDTSKALIKMFIEG